MSSLAKNKTWYLVSRPKDKFIQGCKWAYKIKERTNKREPKRYKVRLVVNEYTQKEEVDYNEIFLSFVKYITIKVMLTFVAMTRNLNNLMSKLIFLHGDIDKKTFMKQS